MMGRFAAALRRGIGACLVALVAMAGGEALAGGRVALVIGNAAYASAPLANPVNDARAMASRLSALGFEVSVLTDASRREMERAMIGFSQRLGEDTTALFYYAGHGVQSQGRNYLLPIGVQIDSEAALRFEAVDVGDLLGEIAQSRSRVNFVILDACRNNPFERKVRGGGTGLAAIDAARGTLIAYATAPGSVAVDGEGSNGLYTAELLKALEMPGLKAEDVFKRVRIAVADQSRGLQVPWESSSLTGDFVFNRASPGTGQGNDAAAQPPVSLEQRLWDGAREMDTPAAYQAYLDQYPDGVFAGLARLRMGQPARPAVRAAEGSSCDMAGRWHNQVPSLDCESTLTFTARDDGTYALQEAGCGDVVGEARRVGDMVVIDWRHSLLCQGRTELRVDADCLRATGEVVMPSGFLGCSGRHASTVTRMDD